MFAGSFFLGVCVCRHIMIKVKQDPDSHRFQYIKCDFYARGGVCSLMVEMFVNGRCLLTLFKMFVDVKGSIPWRVACFHTHTHTHTHTNIRCVMGGVRHQGGRNRTLTIPRGALQT